MSVVIETTIGDITVDLFTDERPVACLNFMKLCQLKYYNYNLFHTVERGFIAQTGDPSGSGDGGSSVWGLIEGSHKRFFEAENLPKIYHSSAGLLSLVSAGKNLVGSQFFFTLGDNLTSLDGIHCVIGEVVEGHETLRKLNEAIVDEKFRPYQDIRITHTVILEDPFPDPRGFRVPERSPSPSAERLKNGRIAADEDIDDTDGKTMEEIQEMLAEREAKARATILEIVGDLPDAEMAPPENVLFVCKLNPLTSDDDLEIIFSRFGKVKNCEVIRDRKTGDSLQYAFVEFENQKACEAAFFKMDNVLIDDRRIHVDFSQSVAKVKWRGKGRGVEGSQGRIDFNNLRENDKRSGERRERPKRSFDDSRNRMTSEERRKAREERHRRQEKEEPRRQRSRSRSRENRSRNREESRYYKDDRRRQLRSPSNSSHKRERAFNNNSGRFERRPEKRNDRYESQRDGYRNRRQSRSRSPSNDRRQREQGRRRNDADDEEYPRKRQEERKRNLEEDVDKRKRNLEKQKKVEKKKSRKDSTTETESSDSDIDSSSDDTSSSSSEEEEKRHKKRKEKKTKHKKKKSKKSHKKHKK